MKNSLCFIIIFCAFTSRSQKSSEAYFFEHKVKQDNLSMNFFVLGEEASMIQYYKNNKFYYWYKSQSIQSTQGQASGRLLHGVYEAFYPNKNLAEKGHFTLGLKDGSWYYWRPEGSLIKSEYWRRGKQRRKQIIYDANGIPKEIDHIHWISRKRRTKDSLIVTRIFDRKKVITYDDSGKKEEVKRFKKNKLHGASCSFKNGKITEKKFYKSGIEKVKEHKIGWTIIKKEPKKKKKKKATRKEQNDHAT